MSKVENIGLVAIVSALALGTMAQGSRDEAPADAPFGQTVVDQEPTMQLPNGCKYGYVVKKDQRIWMLRVNSSPAKGCVRYING